MPTVSLRSVALSLTFHGLLLGAAARQAPIPPRQFHVAVDPLEGAITVDAANGDTVSDSAPALAGPEHPLVRSSLPVGKTVASIAAPARSPTSRPPAQPLEPRARPPRTPPAVAVAAAAAIPSLAPSPLPPVTPSPSATLPAPLAAEVGALAGLPAVAGAPPSAPAEAPEAEWASPQGLASPEGRGAAGTGTGGARVGAGGPETMEGATGNGHAQLLASYLKGVRDRVSRHREYPYLARRANLEGTVCLRVVVAASGGVVGVTPTCGGAHQPLVEAALASVSSAAPFPPLPAALGQRLTIDVPVVFALDQL
jgi:periplasmic protein TonB